VSFVSNDVIANDVIIADNDHIIRGILRSTLERCGFNVLPTTDGLEALDYATRTVARLVILDFRMDKLDGLAACSQIRRLPGYADVPIAILSAFGDKGTRAAAQRAGATTFFAKPFTTGDLLRGIALLLGSPPSDGDRASGAPEPVAVVWKRRQEPTPLYGEPEELSEGRRLLSICRR
jgi:CheY-like chemotaxis protein